MGSFRSALALIGATVAMPAIGHSEVVAGPKPRSCVAYNTVYSHDSTIGCSVQPGAGIGCPLGLGFFRWRCSNGQWVRLQ
jgi:hypothetical protein